MKIELDQISEILDDMAFSIFTDIRESLVLILSEELKDQPYIRANILDSLDNAIANNWDELIDNANRPGQT